MRVKLEITDKYETEPQGKTIDKIFEDVLQDIHAEMNAISNEELHVASGDDVTVASILVSENNSNMNITLKCNYGSQERGYLVEIEISDSGQVEPETAEKVYDNLVTILERRAKIRS